MSSVIFQLFTNCITLIPWKFESVFESFEVKTKTFCSLSHEKFHKKAPFQAYELVYKLLNSHRFVSFSSSEKCNLLSVSRASRSNKGSSFTIK